MSILPNKDLAALGLAPEMLGPVERLPLPAPAVDEARGFATPAASLLDARSDVLRTIGVDLRLDPVAGVLQLEWAPDTPVRIRGAHRAATQTITGDAGLARLGLRQIGRFLMESLDGVPLVLGVLDNDTLHLAAVSAWPAPPLDHWTGPMTDEWLQSTVEQALPGADSWTRTALAGMIARLSAAEPPAGARDAGIAPARQGGLFDGATARALLRRVSASPATTAPRAWARALEHAALASIEEHARRRAIALEHDLDDLLALLPLDDEATRRAWTRLCHRRDDLEGVRLLLNEAGSGRQLDEALREADSAGRSMRISLAVSTDDERLRRVALGDPGAWWGDSAYEVRLL